ncbi:MAG: type II toxin-antitoxin system PemK/MazF family toxin [Candidatus Contendobacter sp.]|nr:type II toxin-antitoxin system PemK/MazF family toxin [Candidatus Contendobacter sp.]MDG4559243.1 type II toxin-antitoxin system PemK/MazF family toxin [Candidatus Contendobacter sp.]
MRRGEVWIGNLNPNRGAEIGKVRPVLIVQEDRLIEAGSPTLVVLPLTTQVRPALQHLRVLICARDRLQQDCQVMVDQPRTLDRGRFGEGPLTRLTSEEIAQVKQALLVLLGLY